MLGIIMNKSLIYCFALVISVNILFATNPAGISKGFRNYLFDLDDGNKREEKSLSVLSDAPTRFASLSSCADWPSVRWNDTKERHAHLLTACYDPL